MKVSIHEKAQSIIDVSAVREVLREPNEPSSYLMHRKISCL